MTTVTPKRLIEGIALTALNVNLYASPANTKTLISAPSVLNITGGAILLTVYLVPSGGSEAAANAAISAYSIGANSSYQCPELVNQVLESGDYLSARASSGTSLSMTVSGIQFS